MRQTITALVSLMLLVSCGKKFPDVLAKAEKAFAEKNYVDVVDVLNNGLPAWEDADGNDAKGRAYELLGNSYHQLRNTDKAIDAYTQAAALSNKTFDSAYALGNLYLVKNQPALAEKNFLDALKKKPDDPLALLGLGNSYFAQKKFPESLAAFEKVLDVSPGVCEAQESLRIIRSRSAKKSYSLPVRKKTRR